MDASPLNLPAKITQHLYATADAAAAALAAAIAQQLRAAVAARGQASLMLSGGRSPIPFFQRLSGEALAWPQVTISLVDDRWVDAASEDSNEHLLREYLLKDAAAAARFIPLKNAARDPEHGLVAAEAALSAIESPFDALVLGVGGDGHTASLFPCARETPAALTSTRRLAATHPTTALHARITLSLPAILDSRVLYVQIGGDKRQVVERAFAAEPPLPIGAVLQQSRSPTHLYWSP